MNKKWLGLAGLAGIIVGCSALIQGATTNSTGPGEKQVAPAIVETEVATVTESNDVAAVGENQTLTEAGVTGAEVEPKDESEMVAPRSSSIVGLPKPENKLLKSEYRWSQLLARDAIFPVYNPQFASAEEAPYNDDELVIGVELNGEAKAYAIGPLNSREMVNDIVGGVPILVTW